MTLVHDLTDNLSSFISKSRQGGPAPIAWKEIVETGAPLIYKHIVYEFGGFSSKDVIFPTTAPDIEVNRQKVAIVKKVYNEISDRFSLPHDFVDVYILPMQQKVSCLTGVFPNLSRKPICLMPLEGFDTHLDLFELVSIHEFIHAAQMYYGFNRLIASDDGPIFECLWNEGMAEYVAYSSMKKDFPVTPDSIQKMASEMLTEMDYFIASNSTVHQKWFGTIGYTLGYYMFQRIAQNGKLDQLIQLDPRSYRDLVIKTLTEMSAAD